MDVAGSAASDESAVHEGSLREESRERLTNVMQSIAGRRGGPFLPLRSSVPPDTSQWMEPNPMAPERINLNLGPGGNLRQ